MELGQALLAVGNGERAASFEGFSETLDPAWIAQALAATGAATVRRRQLPDTSENDARFGRRGTSRGGAAAGYPQLRLVALMVLRSHLLAGLALGAYRAGELTLAAGLWPQLPDASLVILDREFATYALF